MSKQQTINYRLRSAILLVAILVFAGASMSQITAAQEKPVQLDPAAWGSNHIGKPVPDFVTSGECLFCHRNTIGPTWQKNAHGTTVQQRNDAPQWENIFQGQTKLVPLAKEIEFFLGSRHHLRFLKKKWLRQIFYPQYQSDTGCQ